MSMELDDIKKLFLHYKAAKDRFSKQCRELDAYDTGKIWDLIKPNLPDHYLLSDTNYVNYIKTNQMNSIYSGGYIANVTPKNFTDEPTCKNVNRFLDFIFEKLNMPYLQLLAGERTSLLNVGAIQVAWDAKSKEVTQDYTGDVLLKFIDPSSLYLDPSVKEYEKGSALFIAEIVPRSSLSAEHQQMLKDADIEPGAIPAANTNSYGKEYIDTQPFTGEDDNVALLTAYIKNDNHTISQYIIANETVILSQKDEIKPNYFPVGVLFNTPPTKDPYGVPVTKLVLRNIMILNLMDSIPISHIFASQQTAKILNTASGISGDFLARNIYNPQTVIEVQIDPSKVLTSVDLPDLPKDMPQYRALLEQSIQLISGIDPTYTGRNTNSISTTGGMERLQQRAALTDSSRITMLEQFVKYITKLILEFYVNFGSKYVLPISKKQAAAQGTGQEQGTEREIATAIATIDFEAIRNNKVEFEYAMNATPYLPRNKARYAEAANLIMQSQMQYQFNPPLITASEWLSYQEFPQKDIIAERMERDEAFSTVQDVQETVVNFTSLINQGVRPEAAVEMIANEKQFSKNNSKLGNVGNANSAQDRQSGVDIPI